VVRQPPTPHPNANPNPNPNPNPNLQPNADPNSNPNPNPNLGVIPAFARLLAASILGTTDTSWRPIGRTGET